jgi:hypothetical protein
VEALTKEKKEKGNVLIDLELVNLRSVFLFYFEEFKMTTKTKQKSWWRQIRNIKEIYSISRHSWRL